MARSATLFLLSIIALNAEAQTWCAPGAEWLFNFYSQQAIGVKHARYTGDTIVGGLPCRRIDHTTYAYQPIPPFGSPFTFQDQPLFTNGQGDVVQLWDPSVSEFDTLAWFGAVPGDHWGVPGYPGLARFDVLDTGTRMVDGLPLRYLVVEEPIVMGITDTLYERIGFEYYYVRPVESLMLDVTTNWLICYKDNAITLFDGWWPGNEPCDFSVAVSERPEAAELMVHPNPGTDHFTIQLPTTTHDGSLALFNTQGRIVLHRDLSRPSTRINCLDLESGLFTYRITDDGGTTIASGRWVKE